MKEKIKGLYKALKVVTQNIAKMKNRIIYKIKKKICDLKYRRLTYIPEKGIWISTVVFPVEITDGIYGVTDVFPGNEKRLDPMPLHSVYIKKASESGDIHRDVVKCVRSGHILKNDIGIM